MKVHVFKNQKGQASDNYSKLMTPPVRIDDLPLNQKVKYDDTKRCTTLKIPMNPGLDVEDWNSSNTHQSTIPIFNSGTQLEYLAYRKDVALVIEQMALGNDDADREKNVYLATLGKESRDLFVGTHRELTEDMEAADAAGEAVLTDREIIEHTLNEMAKEAFPDWQHAYRLQKRYMKQSLVMKADESPSKFIDKLVEMNNLLPYFPRNEEVELEPHQSMSQEELLEILDSGKPNHWVVHMTRQNKYPWDFQTGRSPQTYS